MWRWTDLHARHEGACSLRAPWLGSSMVGGGQLAEDGIFARSGISNLGLYVPKGKGHVGEGIVMEGVSQSSFNITISINIRWCHPILYQLVD